MQWRSALRSSKTTTVRVKCSAHHTADLRVDAVSIAHAGGTVTGYRFDCPTCGAVNEVSSAPAIVSLLHAFGAAASPSETELPAPPAVVSPARTVVSLRVLLDSPDLLTALAMPSTSATSTPEPTSTPTP